METEKNEDVRKLREALASGEYDFAEFEIAS